MSNRQRLSIQVIGWVQGVGFRPFVYRLAQEYQLTGWVANTPEGVTLEIEGELDALNKFRHRLSAECPAVARIESLTVNTKPSKQDTRFELRTSNTAGSVSSFVLPDLAPCPHCVGELFDPGNRRYRYPFISCTDCGPRWSLLSRLPFDRERTSMANFPLCPTCQAEYHDPDNRRFHAQTQCCPDCGPQWILSSNQGQIMAQTEMALQQAVELLRQGGILAMKGIGGYQLIVDAGNEAAVTRLRERKSRPAKPLAIMCASVADIKNWVSISALEQQVLESSAAPIVLLRKKPSTLALLAPSLAPDIPLLGILLPASPLHHLLINDCGFPLVVTSGNRGGEPLCITEDQALIRLGNIADAFLTHDRPIQRPLDDSVVRVVADDMLMLRRGRGYSPMIKLPKPVHDRIALGGHLKNTVAIGRGEYAILSQHLGDLDNTAAEANFQSTLTDISMLFNLKGSSLVCDLHPDYASSRYANEQGITPLRVQHHHAHVLACLAEHEIRDHVLGVAFDGLGLGTDGTLWGGEFLVILPQGYERVASMRPFRLPGGTQAVREPRRVAYSLLHQILGSSATNRTDLATLAAFRPAEKITLTRMLEARLNSPECSSIGRLYDAVASLLNLCQISRFEGEASMLVEFAADGIADPEPYPFLLRQPGQGTERFIIDWEPLILAILDDLPDSSPQRIAARFQQTLVDIILTVATQVGLEHVALSGGVFQNGWLTTRTLECLQKNGFTVLRHRLIPPNDGGLSIGQLLATT